MKGSFSRKYKTIKTTVPSKEIINKLVPYLRPGKNTVEFMVQNDENTSVPGFIYFWDSSTKCVVTDVDGTVTRSDFLGHVLPRIGASDWAHEGIANLYTSISQNGY